MTCIIPNTNGVSHGPLPLQDAAYVVQPAAFSFLNHSPSLALEFLESNRAEDSTGHYTVQGHSHGRAPSAQSPCQPAGLRAHPSEP